MVDTYPFGDKIVHGQSSAILVQNIYDLNLMQEF